MSKSAIYTTNNNAQVLAVGNTINLGSIVRRFGQNVNLNNSNIIVSGAGYYKIDADVTIAGTNAGTATISLLKDGNVVTSTSTTIAVGDEVTIPIIALVREYGCCCDNRSNLSFVLTGTAETVNSINVIVEKI